MNRKVIDLLQPTLLAYSSTAAADLVRKSLSGAQAKVWIDESEVKVERHFHDITPEIDFPRWIKNSEDGAGPRAPIGTRLIVYGGWIDKGGREQVDPHKEYRSEEIHQCGFT
jgi:hypothetical protein